LLFTTAKKQQQQQQQLPTTTKGRGEDIMSCWKRAGLSEAVEQLME